MRDPGSDELDVASSDVSNEDFTLRRSQQLGLGVLGLLLIALVVLLIKIVRFDTEHVILILVVALIILVSGTLLYSRLRDFRGIRVRLDGEHRELEQTSVALKRVDGELQTQIDNDRTERGRQQWLASTTRSISSQFKSTIASDKIAEFVAAGLGPALGADSVICYSFSEPQWSGFLKQWHRRTDTQVDESLIDKYASQLSALANRLWRSKSVFIVPDSHLIDVSSDSTSELLVTTRQRARSWVFSPVADGSRVLGYVFIAMTQDVRVWSPIEVELIQQVASDAANVCVHSRMFSQTMRIAENDATVGRLAELDKVKNVFIENMNHELRSPLASIIGYMEVIIGGVDSGLEPDLAASLSVVQRSALRLQILIENMVQLSKTEFHQVPPLVVTVDIGYKLSDAIKSMELAAEYCQIEVTLRLDSPADELLIDGDVDQLECVFANLLSNAIKYTPRRGKVSVVARRVHTEGSDFVEVTVTDTGIGIPPEEFPNVFKRYFRASTATQAAIPGFGIGLSLVHSIIDEHHGTITFESTVGKGTVFTVTLPLRHTVIKPQT